MQETHIKLLFVTLFSLISPLEITNASRNTYKIIIFCRFYGRSYVKSRSIAMGK